VATFIGGAATLTVLAVLAIALLEHGLRPGSLPHALAAQETLPRTLAVPVAAGVVAAEAALLVAGGLGVAQGAGGGMLIRTCLGAAAVLFGVYALYTYHLVTTRDGVPCGCGGADTPVSRWVVGRAAVLAAVAVVGLLLADQAAALGDSRAADQVTVVLVASLTFAVLLWHLPAAMEDPARQVLQRGRQRFAQRVREGAGS
jgi:hypothetical protein